MIKGLNTLPFRIIQNVIKSWDINIPEINAKMYSGLNNERELELIFDKAKKYGLHAISPNHRLTVLHAQNLMKSKIIEDYTKHLFNALENYGVINVS